MLHVDVISLFPEMFAPVIGLSIVGRAIERDLIAVRVHDLLDGLEPGARADERPYGGGPGMVLRIEPLARTLDGILAAAPPGERRRIVLTAAAGRPFGQSDAEAFAQLDRLVLICGHYEGVDERLAALYPLEEFSLGAFVLTGGEIAAMAFLDATARLIDGVIAAESRDAESFAAGTDAIDHPAFTRPPVFRGVAVPEVLLSGDHAKFADGRRQRARDRAAARRN
jgi:tRNA (guanine37-N1)-methyltransferase